MRRSRLDLDDLLPGRRWRVPVAVWLGAALGLVLGLGAYLVARPPALVETPPVVVETPTEAEGAPPFDGPASKRPGEAPPGAGRPGRAAAAPEGDGRPAAPPGAAAASPGTKTAPPWTAVGPSATVAAPSGTAAAPPAPASGSDGAPGSRTYRVRRGDTLTGIAARPDVYGDRKAWRRIYDANRDRLDDPDRLQPGQLLVIP